MDKPNVTDLFKTKPAQEREEDFTNPPAKRLKMEANSQFNHSMENNINGALKDISSASILKMQPPTSQQRERRKGEAPIKPEFLIYDTGTVNQARRDDVDDDATEGSTLMMSGAKASHITEKGGKNNRKKERGQNKNRQYGSWGDSIQLCKSRATSDEFSPVECNFSDNCKLEHDLRRYLREGKRKDLTTFDGMCPIWDVRGFCNAGWKCRFAGSHSLERESEGGRKELVLVRDEKRMAGNGLSDEKTEDMDVFNVIGIQTKFDLSRRKVQTPKADEYIEWVEKWKKEPIRKNNSNCRVNDEENDEMDEGEDEITTGKPNGVDSNDREDNRASYIEPPLLPSEKRRLYYGPETPILAPLTTQGNLPFRRLCISLGAQITWSEMAMGMPLIQGEKSEWALVKAHLSEVTPPTVDNDRAKQIVTGYENKKDLKFGVQIAANKPWLACKTTEILSNFCPKLRAIDLNCGCPIDLVYRQGSGSALLDNRPKLEMMIRGMNTCSGEIPITVKIRMGTKDNAPTADKLVERLVLGNNDMKNANLGPCGIAAVTLHGRSRQQRYSKLADWMYISEIASIVQNINEIQGKRVDTVREPDQRVLPNGGKTLFVGNGDVYSHIDYYEHLEKDKVDGVMVARGALIKPWIFEEIANQQYIDKSASERLSYIEKFVRFGLETWGSDEIGVGTTRRFLLEWLCFACRYVPLGLLEVLPPRINERPPRYKGRNELETLLSSDNYKDWMKIR
jgi:tRNA-dihydrouridine synthase 3